MNSDITATTESRLNHDSIPFLRTRYLLCFTGVGLGCRSCISGATPCANGPLQCPPCPASGSYRSGEHPTLPLPLPLPLPLTVTRICRYNRFESLPALLASLAVLTPSGGGTTAGDEKKGEGQQRRIDGGGTTAGEEQNANAPEDEMKKLNYKEEEEEEEEEEAITLELQVLFCH